MLSCCIYTNHAKFFFLSYYRINVGGLNQFVSMVFDKGNQVNSLKMLFKNPSFLVTFFEYLNNYSNELLSDADTRLMKVM